MKFLFFFIQIIFTINVSEGTCEIGETYDHQCSSIDDLRTYIYFSESSSVSIERKDHSGSYFKTLEHIKSEHVKNISVLVIKNTINGFSSGAFNNFVNLKSLTLIGNQIDHIGSDLFTNIKMKMHQLSFFNNGIKSISQRAFENLQQLRLLWITGNELTTIKSRTFVGLSLRILRLEKNGIQEIERGAFTDLPILNTLILTGNNFPKIKTGIFNNLEIQFLNLSQNHISEIEPRAFFNLSKLKYLYLSGNYLEMFEAEEIFKTPESLKILFLNDNKFGVFSADMLQGLINLEQLSLNGNFLSTIEQDTFLVTPNLQVLFLARNQITVLNGNILPSTRLRTLHTLDLNHNQLQYLSPLFISRLPTLRTLSIGGNPWQCACYNLLMERLHFYSPGVCDKYFFQGNFPICVVPMSNEKTCSYSYDNQSTQLYYTVYNSVARTYKSCNYINVGIDPWYDEMLSVLSDMQQKFLAVK